MRVFDLLRLMNPELQAGVAKVHLAGWNGYEDPLDVYLAGQFNDWQSWQRKRNFERRFVVSFISLPAANQWLFAGVYLSSGAIFHPHQIIHNDTGWYRYELSKDSNCSPMNGRLIASFSRPSRQSYLNAELWTDKLTLHSILPEPLSVAEFPGFKAINLTKAELDLVVRQSPDSWRTALSSVAGVYLISDTASGMLYVGSACGEGGIWQRWVAYAGDGHGGNVELRQLLEAEGPDRANHFRYSILEIADLHASTEEILKRESHWKKVLLSRSHGLNKN